MVLLAGGVGKRMGASIPKQYLKLRGQEIATYSMDTFAHMREVAEIVIVCDPSWRDVFERRMPALPKHVVFKWALPGAERQVRQEEGGFTSSAPPPPARLRGADQHQHH